MKKHSYKLHYLRCQKGLNRSANRIGRNAMKFHSLGQSYSLLNLQFRVCIIYRLSTCLCGDFGGYSLCMASTRQIQISWTWQTTANKLFLLLIHENACFPAAIGDNAICQIMLKPNVKRKQWHRTKLSNRHHFLHKPTRHSPLPPSVYHSIAYLSHFGLTDFVPLFVSWFIVIHRTGNDMTRSWRPANSLNVRELVRRRFSFSFRAKWIGASGWHRFLNGIHNKHTTNECTM